MIQETKGGLCERCNEWSDKLQKHHKIRKRDGGSDSEDNIEWLCSPCHKIESGDGGDYTFGGKERHRRLREELGEEGYKKFQSNAGKGNSSEQQKQKALKMWKKKNGSVA